jgi:hypothetical protein
VKNFRDGYPTFGEPAAYLTGLAPSVYREISLDSAGWVTNQRVARAGACIDRCMSHEYDFPAILESQPKVLVRGSIARKKGHEENDGVPAHPGEEPGL